jgi:UDP-N-acetylmuramate dehydrogenase
MMGIQKVLPGVEKNVFLKNYTTFRIGGPAKYFYSAKTKKDIIKAILVAKKLNLPFFILTGGSNLLVSDRGFKGLVIRIENRELRIKNHTIYAEAGTPLALVVSKARENNLTGLEWAIGIPGMIGGAIKGNAGAFGKSMADIVKSVEVFDVKTEKVKKLSKKDCKFSYKESIFKKNPNLIILSVELKLKKGNEKKIKEKLKEYLDYRKKTQPLGFFSAGSIFKNPKGFFVGELGEKCGLKGKKIGQAEISEKHANFIVNLGKAKAKDVIELIKLIKRKVKNKFNIELEEEIQYLGFEK